MAEEDAPPPYSEVAETPIPQPTEPQVPQSSTPQSSRPQPPTRPPPDRKKPEPAPQTKPHSGAHPRPPARPPTQPQTQRPPQHPPLHHPPQHRPPQHPPQPHPPRPQYPPPNPMLRYPPNYWCYQCQNTGTKPSGSSCKDCWAMFGPRNTNVQYTSSSWHRPPGRAVAPGDPALGGVLCGRCRGSGVTHELLLFEETCAVCRGVGRIL